MKPVLLKRVKDNATEIESTLREAYEFLLPQETFSKGNLAIPVKVLYISDMHLDEHFDVHKIARNNSKAIKRYIDGIIAGLVDSNEQFINSKGETPEDERELLDGHYYMFYKLHSDLPDDEIKELSRQLKKGEKRGTVPIYLEQCLCFLGDLASTTDLARLFFERLLLRIKYHHYVAWKRYNHSHYMYKLEEFEKKYNDKLKKVENDICTYKRRISLVEKSVGKKNLYSYYSKKDDYDIERLINANKVLPNYLSYLIIGLKDLVRYRDILRDDKEDIFAEYKRYTILDFACKEIIHCPIFYVLGNHEMSQYDTVEKAQKEYKKALKTLGVTVLQNDAVEYENCVVLGGTAFAKNNERYNANNLIGPKSMTGNRELEAKETDNFVDVYKKSLDQAIDNAKPVIVFTHYPLQDWMSMSVSKYGFYFNGHNHQNSLTINEKCHIYADNQIGYSSDEIAFKEAIIGTCYNPFVNYEDGYYEITSKQYQDFNNYSGEFIKVRMIQKRIDCGEKLYLIKRNGFYGFFLVSEKNTKICFGGSIKTIGQGKDIKYYYDSFGLMLYAYLKALMPYRRCQEKISSEIIASGVQAYNAGRIHGTIIDVDFYHHIMLNPFDATLTFYYSPVFGMVQAFESFEELLVSVKEKDKKSIESVESGIKALPKGAIVLKTSKEISKVLQKEIQHVDIKSSLYATSRKINQLQRLFTSNILRAWDDEIINTIAEAEMCTVYNGKSISTKG